MGGILDLPLIQFMGAVLELLLYGVYVVLFAGTMWVLRKRRRGADASAVSPVIEVCSWFMFVVLSIHCGATIYFTYHGFLVLGTNPLGQLIFLADLGSKTNLVREAMYGLCAVGTETLLIYRLWIVWGRWWPVTVVPSALVVFDFIGFVISLHGSDHTSSPALARATTVWLEPVIFFCEAFTNILCSGLIAWRIARNSLRGAPVTFAGRGMKPVLWIISESAAVYATFSAIVAVGLILEQPMIFVFMAIIPPVAGITSCLLLVRVGLSMAAEKLSDRTPRGTSTGPPESFGMKVSVTRHALSKTDAESALGPEDKDASVFAGPSARSRRADAC